jgi:hypothetical protein
VAKFQFASAATYQWEVKPGLGDQDLATLNLLVFRRGSTSETGSAHERHERLNADQA